MKLVVVWIVSMAVFWLWFVLSLHDLGFGLFVLSREFHDSAMMIYGWTLGIDPTHVPHFFAEAFGLDGLLVGGIVAYRRRRPLAVWLAGTSAKCVSAIRPILSTRAGPAHPAE